ncbi:AraC family transcriptional regulator [Microbacterium sp. RD1]|uniref:AraC family transcriptional regulator n=1 Tax=Microbacterium sp. RD1 TaxID=3457313 RepID=UPI003FA563DB
MPAERAPVLRSRTRENAPPPPWRASDDALPLSAETTSDIEAEAERALAPLTAAHELATVRGERFHATVGSSQFGQLTVIEQRYRGLHAIEVTEPAPVLTITMPLRDDMSVSLGGRRLKAPRGEVMVFDAGSMPHMRTSSAADFLTLALPASVVSDYARAHAPWIDGSEPIRFRPLALGAGSALRPAAWRVVEAVRSGEDDDLADLVASALLFGHPHSHSMELLLSGSTASDAVVWDAAALLLDAPDSRIRLPDLAQMVGVGVRSLQIGFRRVFDTTVSEFQRDLRLESARVLLERDSRTGVAEIAATVGYVNAGRFSRDFARRYGASPSAYRRAR